MAGPVDSPPMARWPKLLAIPAVVGLAGLAQVLRAAHRPDLPAFPNLDLSGTFGDPTLPPLRIVGIGDSNLTAPGVGHIDDAWPRRVAATLADRYRVELISLGRGGSRTRQVTAEQLERALALRPDIALVAAGGNDTLRVMPAWVFRRQLSRLVGSLHQAAKAVVVLGIGDLGTIPRLPGFVRWFLSRRSRTLHRSVGMVVTRYPRAVLIETWAGIAHALRHRNEEMFAADLFHPSSAGHEVFMTEIMPAFEEAVRIYERS